MRDELRSLTGSYPLPPDLAPPDLVGGEVRIGDAMVRRAGIQARSSRGEDVTGSAAALRGSPVTRAYFELLERIALLDAEERRCPLRDEHGRVVGAWRATPRPPSTTSRPARSNGVALHLTWAEACRRARFELAERDRVLGAWYGELPTVPVAPPAWLDVLGETHDWIARSIPAAPNASDSDVAVAMLVGFPRRPEIPLARGSAGRASIAEALDAAASEALQSLAFLWDEPLPTEPPSVAPTPMFHLDFYLWPGHHQRLRDWLETSVHVRPRTVQTAEEIRFADLTPQCSVGSVFVARAVSPGARELIFGELPDELRSELPFERRVHPIA